MGGRCLHNLVHNQGDDSLPMNKQIQASTILLLTLSMVVVVAFIPPMIEEISPTQGKARFILSSWDYPDEYGQGIRNIAIEQYTNSSWVSVTDPSPPKGYYYDSTVYTITTGEGSNGSLWINVQCYLNATLCGIADIDDGPALLRHNITVTNSADSIVFYQENFTLTYQTDAYAPLYFYQYEVFTDFTPVSGEVYTATITYEVFY